MDSSAAWFVSSFWNCTSLFWSSFLALLETIIIIIYRLRNSHLWNVVISLARGPEIRATIDRSVAIFCTNGTTCVFRRTGHVGTISMKSKMFNQYFSVTFTVTDVMFLVFVTVCRQQTILKKYTCAWQSVPPRTYTLLNIHLHRFGGTKMYHTPRFFTIYTHSECHFWNEYPYLSLITNHVSNDVLFNMGWCSSMVHLNNCFVAC